LAERFGKSPPDSARCKEQKTRQKKIGQEGASQTESLLEKVFRLV
jgi:hypothetical protein